MMEKALKERIVGAVVLVVFAILVVPIFLDGPPTDGEVVTKPVLLPGQDEQSVKTVVMERDRSVPIPVANSNDTPTLEEREETANPMPAPLVEQPKVERTPDPVPEPQTAASGEDKADEPPAPVMTASSTGMWAVQLGSFSSKDNAEALAASLRKQGYAAFLSKLSRDGGELHRVRIGPQKDRAGAEEMAAG